jgi:antitoxin component YwqK of YwqJK toxin-antitoxin module
MMTVKDRNMQLKQSKSWYQSGKVKSDFVILALDTVIVFDSIVNDSIIWVDIKKSGKQWHENGTIEQVHSVLSDGSRKIIFYNPAGIPCSEEIYLNNRMIKRDVISNCDSVGVK